MISIVPSASALSFQSTDNLYTCGTNGETDRLVYLRDKNGTPISSFAWNISEIVNQQGCFGMAQDPTDLQWYAIVSQQLGRTLVTFNVTDGTGTAIGVINDQSVNSLTITNNGTFYATNGDANDQVFKIDKTNPSVHLADCSLDSDNEEYNRIGWDYDLDQGIITTNSDQGSAFVTASTLDHFSGFSGSCPMSVVESFVQDTNYNILQTNYCHPFANVYHTEDDVFYAFHQDCIGGGNTYYASLDPVTFDATLINAVSTSGSTAPLKDLVPSYFTGGMAFELAFGVSDTTPPVISAIGGEPAIFYDGDSVFDGVQCIDDTDGAIVPNGEFGTNGGTTIDGENHGLQSQNFFCTDDADNTTFTTIEYLVKRSNSGGGSGGTSSGSGSDSGGTSSVGDASSPSTPLLSLTGDDREVVETGRSLDDIFSIFDNLFNRALDSETGQVVEQKVQETVSDVSQQATDKIDQTARDTGNQAYQSFIDFITGLFR